MFFKFSDKEVKYLFTKSPGFCSKFFETTIISKLNLNLKYNAKDKKETASDNPKINIYCYGRLLVVSSKKTGKAVKRNLIRRRIKQIFVEEKLFKSNFISIIFPSKKLIDTNFLDLKKLLSEHFKQATSKLSTT